MVSPGVVIVYREPNMVEPGAVASISIHSTTPILTAAVNLTKDHDDQGLHCSRGALLGPLGLFVQFLLAFIAFTSLIAKRFCEPKPERRTWKVWFFDTSKQAIGAAVIHFANVFLAGMFHGDPCTWYIVSFLLDSTVGLVVIYVGLQISQCIAAKKGYDNLILGEYGNPPRCHAWAVQCGLYVVVMLVEKLLMTLLVLFNFWKEVRKLILSPIKDPNLELIFTMFIVPFIVNAIIFWVVDNFLKKKKWKSVHTSVHPPESGGMKYFKSSTKVKYYKKTHNEENSESDTLLSFDEESVTESNGHIPKPENSPNCDSSEEYRLL